MRLSEAIALGRMVLKPIGGIRNNQKGGGCALGMAEAAMGGDSVFLMHWWLYQTHDFITLPCDCKTHQVIASCMWKFPRAEMVTYADAIVHVFNYHVYTVKDWTLDQLIDWVRSVEPAEEEAPVHGETVQGEPVAEPALEPAEIEAKTR